MYQIVLVPTGNKANAALFFKDKEGAESAHDNIVKAQQGNVPFEILKVKDDFGVTLTIHKDNICCVMIMDSEKQMELAAIMGGNRNVQAQ
jgi:hypothetical protein